MKHLNLIIAEMGKARKEGDKMSKIKYIAYVKRWLDKQNGNTYHSVRIVRCSDGAIIAAPFQYGYGDHYRQTALSAMLSAGWLPAKYKDKYVAYLFERENDYPIEWHVEDGLKKDCINNGVLKNE